jgi:hypothetical protein
MHCVGKGRIHQPENFPDTGFDPLYRAYDNIFFISFTMCVGVLRYTNHNRPGLWIKGLSRCTLLNISCLNKCYRVTAFAVDFSVQCDLPRCFKSDRCGEGIFYYTCM